METQEKTFNHAKAGIADKIALLSELQHVEAHALRSAVSLYEEESDDSEWVKYAIWAKRAKELRREYQRKMFPELSEYDWCLCKAAARLRQLAYEAQESDYAMLKALDDFVDEIWGTALGTDLSDCSACRDDKAPVEES